MNMSIDWAGSGSAALARGRRFVGLAKEWIQEVDRRVLAGLAVALVLALALLLWVSATDQSRALSAQEAAAVREWALATQSPEVGEAFNAAVADGRLTVNEVRQVMEVSKSAAVPPGLYQPVGGG